MHMSNNGLQMELQDTARTVSWSEVVVPMASAADFEAEGVLDSALDCSSYPEYADSLRADQYAYHNAATCPDCSAGMIRQGRCCVCPSCGFESCLH